MTNLKKEIFFLLMSVHLKMGFHGDSAYTFALVPVSDDDKKAYEGY